MSASASPAEAPVAIVTGGGRGIGRALVLALARAGLRVVATAAREQAEVDAVADEGGRALVHPMLADVAREEDCRAVLDIALDRFGRVDVLVNNAGRGMKYVSSRFLTEPTRFWETDPAVWRLVIDTNVNGPFLMAQAAAPHLIARGWGRIVNIAMNRETMRRRGFSPYGPSKAALESETAIWAQDLAGTGVTVNALLPGGATLTGMIPDGLNRRVQDGLLRPEVVTSPMLWLLTPEADGLTGKRIVASRWPEADGDAATAIEDAGW